MSVRTVRLSEICQDGAPITYGILQPGPIVPGGIPYVRPSEIHEGEIDLSSIRTTTPEIAERYKKSEVVDGDILITIVGTIGSIAVVPPELNGANITQSSARVRVCETIASRDYIKHYLRSPLAARQYNQHRLGVAVPRLNLHHVRDLEIPLPPLEEQRRIAEVLDRADALRQNRRLALQKLDTLLQSVFLDMFGDPVKNPKGWPQQKMGELMVIRRGGSPRPIENFLGGDINWIKIGDATKGDQIYLDSSKEKIVKEGLKKTVYLKSGSLIFANCGVSLGFARILRIDGCIHDGWLSFEDIPEKRLNKVFLLKALNSITDHFRRIAPSGTQPNLNTGIMKTFPMIVPPITLQSKFAKIVERVEKTRISIVESEKVVEGLLRSLQHRAFNGELFPSGTNVQFSDRSVVTTS